MTILGGVNKLWLVAAGLIGTVSYLVLLVIRKRSFYRGLPCPPHSMFWGHLKLIGEYTQKLPTGTYVHYAVTQMKRDYDLPDIFYLDLWPFGPRFMVCTSPDACAIPTTMNTFDMPSDVRDFFAGTIGTTFIEVTNGSFWKHLHQMIAPGLTPNAVKGYNDVMIDEAAALHGRLLDVAKSAQAIDMRNELGLYSFRVMATALFGETLSAEIFEHFKTTAEIQLEINVTNNPFALRRLRKEGKKFWRLIESAFESKIKARFAILQQQKVLPTKATATNLLDRMLMAQVESGKPLDSALTKIALENAKGFIIAGYGTTTDSSGYLLMLLGAFPEALEKLREEHDHFFDKDFDKTVKTLKENPGVLKELKYTAAVINESLRMFPVGLCIRSPPSDMKSFEYKGQSYPTEGHIFALAAHTMQYDAKYFDEPKKFKPERFLASDPAFPRNAYRPFEKGVRSCLGQSMAVDEMKVMLVLLSRWFDLELTGQQVAEKPMVSFTDLDTKIGKHAFQRWGYTAGPPGSVEMKVSLVK